MLLRRMEEKIAWCRRIKSCESGSKTDQQLDGIIGESANIREVLRMMDAEGYL